MHIDFLLTVFQENRNRDAIVWNDNIYKYEWLLERVAHWQDFVRDQGGGAGAVVGVEADFSPNSVALLLALIDHGCILVPLTASVADKRDEFLQIAACEHLFTIDRKDEVQVSRLPHKADYEAYRAIRSAKTPGLVLFSSGSTGKSKAAVHDLGKLLGKFKIRKSTLRSITFLLYDHIGGVNTLLYNLSNAGCLVTVNDRNPDHVLGIIEKYRVELLPTSPTFLNLVLLSEAYRRYDLSSLKKVTYGTEPMQESTLKRLNKVLPQIQFQQTYGLSEVGILRSKSKSSDSLWVKIGGESFQTRVADGILEIKAESAMLGYLNAPSPFTGDGWFHTGDQVEVDGEYMRILGRKSEIINVGGEKVYPAEVESVIQELENVAEVTVCGEPNPITGQIVVARVKLKQQEDPGQFRKRLRQFCRQKLINFKIPQKIRFIDEAMHGPRFKKTRSFADAE